MRMQKRLFESCECCACNHSISFVLEQPATSRYRCLPQMKRIISNNRHKLSEHVVDQCAYGTRYKKSTWLLCGNTTGEVPLESRRCAAVNGLCDYSYKPHTLLQGRVLANLPCHYPKMLCDALADVLLKSGRSLIC